MGYTPGMKTAISIDDQTFQIGERLAQKLKMSRSELYATALRKFAKEEEELALSETYDRVFAALGGQDPETADAVRAAGRRTLERSEW